MTKKEALKEITNWYLLPQRLKSRNWDKVYPLMNKYPDLQEIAIERARNERKKKFSDSNVRYTMLTLF